MIGERGERVEHGERGESGELGDPDNRVGVGTDTFPPATDGDTVAGLAHACRFCFCCRRRCCRSIRIPPSWFPSEPIHPAASSTPLPKLLGDGGPISASSERSDGGEVRNAFHAATLLAASFAATGVPLNVAAAQREAGLEEDDRSPLIGGPIGGGRGSSSIYAV